AYCFSGRTSTRYGRSFSVENNREGGGFAHFRKGEGRLFPRAAGLSLCHGPSSARPPHPAAKCPSPLARKPRSSGGRASERRIHGHARWREGRIHRAPGWVLAAEERQDVLAGTGTDDGNHGRARAVSRDA